MYTLSHLMWFMFNSGADYKATGQIDVTAATTMAVAAAGAVTVSSTTSTVTFTGDTGLTMTTEASSAGVTADVTVNPGNRYCAAVCCWCCCC